MNNEMKARGLLDWVDFLRKQIRENKSEIEMVQIMLEYGLAKEKELLKRLERRNTNDR